MTSASSPRTGNRAHARLLLPCLLVVLVGASLTAVATQFVEHSHQTAERQRFERLVGAATDEVRARVGLYQYGLRGARGLFAACESVERDDFHQYVQSHDHRLEFPGALGLGYIHRVRRADADEYVAAVRADGAPDFGIHSTSDSGDLYVVQYFEPAASNEVVLGFDVGSSPVRRAAAEQAMRTGRGTITAKLELLQHLGEAGFLYFMPVYARGSAPRDEAERVRDLVGWTYVPLVAPRILDGVWERTDGLVEFAAYDDSTEDPERLLYEGRADPGGGALGYEESVNVRVGDRTWRLKFVATPSFQAAAGISPTLVTVIVGVLSTLFLGGLAWSIASREARAVALTELRTRELEVARRAAERAMKVKSEFLANMSHELRTPMTAILGFADVLQEPGLSAAERDAHVNTIRRNGEHLLSILNDILDTSKIEAGQMTVERIPASPKAILEDVVTLLAQKAQEKGLELFLEGLEGLPESITTDPTRWKQILVNVVGNALKFTERGSVRLRARHVPDGVPRLVVEVVDTGIGMTSAQKTRIFQPFRQADESTTRRFGGTGLGLAISKSLAELLGGSIEVESEAGRGTTIRITVAAGAAVDAPAAGPLPASPAGSPRTARISGRILLAEDGRDNQVLIARVLRRAGAEVVVVSDGQQAVQAAWDAHTAGRPYELVLMDMHMPVQDGRAATRELRARGYRGPIVALTASAMPEERAACLEAGCDDFASKPLQPVELVELCSRLAECAPTA